MMNETNNAIEQLERISKNLSIIGETEDYTDIAIQAIEDAQKYRKLEQHLTEMFGGELSLQQVVDELERRLVEPDNPHPFNAKILTYEDAKDWAQYKEIGTPEECRFVMEVYKQLNSFFRANET